MSWSATCERLAGSARSDGVVVRTLTPQPDHRGVFLEIFREAWDLGCHPVQWNAVTSAAGVLRGVHVHVRHEDHLVMASGRLLVGLHDIRPWSATFGASEIIELDARAPCALVVPTGVAHGLYSPEPSLLVYGASRYWDKDDEIGCRWNDPRLRLSWPTTSPILSERDTTAADYPSFVQTFMRAWSSAHGSFPGSSAP